MNTQGLISEDNIKDLIGEAYPVFERTGAKSQMISGKKYFSMKDYDNWLDGPKPSDEQFIEAVKLALATH